MFPAFWKRRERKIFTKPMGLNSEDGESLCDWSNFKLSYFTLGENVKVKH